MRDADMHVGSDQRLNVPNDENAAHEMNDVLLHRLPSFYRCAYRILGNAADAEDAVQDALLAAHKHLGQFRGQSQMSTWLTTIMRNCARMQLRKRPRQIHVALDERISEEQGYSVLERLADGGPNPEDECRNSELNARVRTLAAQLSPTLRRTFQLRDVDGLSISETARILRIPERHRKGSVGAGTSKAQRRNAPCARTATSSISHLRGIAACPEGKGKLESESRSSPMWNPAAVVSCCADEACESLASSFCG
jgi:RNA polymerase sigma factor (sigma-70 family)